MKRRLKIFALICSLFLSSHAIANSECERTATINYQNVLVNTGSSQKGEGLRYYIEKDPQALEYLEKYQDTSDIELYSAIIGTTGTLVAAVGAIGDFESSTKTAMIVTGASIILVNFLIANTMKSSNEKYLEKAVEEYNKNNTPKIYLNAVPTNNKDKSFGIDGLMLSGNWRF